jgi:AraC family transcriptional regulator
MTVAPMSPETTTQQGNLILLPEFANCLTQLLESASKEIDSNHQVAKATIVQAASLLRAALAETGAQSGDVARGKLAAWQVNRLKAYIEERLDQPIRVEDLAQIIHRSSAYFCRVFKRTFGETPHAYVVQRRLVRARYLMLTTGLALSEIALKCGFADQAHFCRLFRLTVAQSPALWRRQIRNDPNFHPGL